ncbi:hypothetical protein Tamer19_05730 [Cupriavidus sp. TA19]|nr:hypothetical protein Tamer19_05730 [Cupriavidus sp. TA19]
MIPKNTVSDALLSARGGATGVSMDMAEEGEVGRGTGAILMDCPDINSRVIDMG